MLDHVPIVILSTGNGRWNTGVWTGFGDPRPTLNWAAAGVVVDKSSCTFECIFTNDQSKLVSGLSSPPTSVASIVVCRP